MSNSAQDTMDIGQLLNNAARNYAELAGDAALAAGTTAKVVVATLAGQTLVFNIIIDVTLNNEPVEQAVVSQVAALAVGAVGIAVIGTSSGVLLAAAGVAVASYGADKFVDWLYSMNEKEWQQFLNTRIVDVISNACIGIKNFFYSYDPLALDLDGDGIETTSVNNSTLFDQNADGIKTGTGWIKGDDALLVRDLNNNGTIDTGRELFGDQTLLSNGQLAANGYAALADLDSNHDGKIDASDTAFSQLKIWRDANQDGVSQADELQTLDVAGISSIGLSTTNTNKWQNGNTITTTGTYAKTDGTTGTTGDINLSINTAKTEFTDTIEIPESLQNLPDMPGLGKVRDLRQAAALSPKLANLLVQYVAATTREEQMALIDQLLLSWTDTSSIAKTLDERAALAGYNVEYLSFGTVSRNSHLQQNTGTTTVTSTVTNANNPLIDETYRDLITSWNNKINILEAFNGSYLGCADGYANEVGGRARG